MGAPRFYIVGSALKRPASRKTIFADGDSDSTFRDGVDIELSHWVPNKTPSTYKADTSTGCCMKFIEQRATDDWDLAINNHLDVDGVLSIFTLVDAALARAERQTIVQAAEMGDFWGWGEQPAQVLFQGLTLLMDNLQAHQVDVQEIYERCFDRARELIGNSNEDDPGIREGLAALRRSLDLVESGVIVRRGLHRRFTHFHVPCSVAQESWELALSVPAFNAPLGEAIPLLPQVRNRRDHDRVQLVSIESVDGWHYDLYYPGYMWADTPEAWRAPGLEFSGSKNGYYYGHRPLDQAVLELEEAESGAGRWRIADEVTPFSTLAGRGFPVVLSFLDNQDRPARSHLPPASVASILAAAFDS